MTKPSDWSTGVTKPSDGLAVDSLWMATDCCGFAVDGHGLLWMTTNDCHARLRSRVVSAVRGLVDAHVP